MPSNFLLHEWTQLRWCLDSNVIDDESADELLCLADLGWVWLSVTDTAHFEASQNPAKHARLLGLLERYDVVLGPFTIGHSSLHMSIIASDDDDERHRTVHRLLWPNADFAADGREDSRTGKNRFRDSMHVSTAIRYVLTGFVTQDTRVLNGAALVAEHFDRFAVVNIADAISRSKTAARRVRVAAAVHGQPDPASIPEWPA